MNKKPRQLPQIGEKAKRKGKRASSNTKENYAHNHNFIKNEKRDKLINTAFGGKKVRETPDYEDKLKANLPGISFPRNVNKILGQKIRIEVNKHNVDHQDLNTNHDESSNLLFYDFNAGARQFRFGGSKNSRLGTRGEFRRTGMQGAKFIDHDIIETEELEGNGIRKRPTTSHNGGGDRLPSRQIKTRERARKVYINKKKKPTKKEKLAIKKKNISPQNSRVGMVNNNHRKDRQSLHTAFPVKKKAIFEEFEDNEYIQHPHYRLRERMAGKNIIIEEQENFEEDQEPSREVYAL